MSDSFELRGPRLTLRIPEPDDSAALFRLGPDTSVTRWFSWGPYTDESEAAGFLAQLPAQRVQGTHLTLLQVHRDHGPVGITGLSEFSRRDRRAVIGSWLSPAHWGTGINAESKALVCHLAFRLLGLRRITAYASVRNVRSQRALAKVGFRREGVLRAWHRHGDEEIDSAAYAMLSDQWATSPLAAVPVDVRGRVPAAFVPDITDLRQRTQSTGSEVSVPPVTGR